MKIIITLALATLGLALSSCARNPISSAADAVRGVGSGIGNGISSAAGAVSDTFSGSSYSK